MGKRIHKAASLLERRTDPDRQRDAVDKIGSLSKKGAIGSVKVAGKTVVLTGRFTKKGLLKVLGD